MREKKLLTSPFLLPCTFLTLKAADHGNRVTFNGKNKMDSNNLFVEEALQSHQFHVSQLRTIKQMFWFWPGKGWFCSSWNGARLQPRGYCIPSNVIVEDGEKGLSFREKRNSFWLSEHDSSPEPEEVVWHGMSTVGKWALQWEFLHNVNHSFLYNSIFDIVAITVYFLLSSKLSLCPPVISAFCTFNSPATHKWGEGSERVEMWFQQEH